jgi:uncharacterized protein YndB with AHSA1/START domain
LEANVWTNEHRIETEAGPQAVWRLWTDVAGWPQWNGDIEKIELRGPFAAGSTIVMTPFGGDPIELCIAEAVANERFVDEASLGDVVVRTLHEVRATGGGRSEIVYRMEVTGPGAAELGAQISADFPETIAALAAHAQP